MASYKGSCFCGEINDEDVGETDAMLVCYYQVCRSWSERPVNGAAIFKPENPTITKGKESLLGFAKNEGHDRSWCSKCGGHVLTDHTGSYGAIDVYVSILEDFEFKPVAQINYESTILPIKGGLPKFRGFPADFGGTVEIMPE